MTRTLRAYINIHQDGTMTLRKKPTPGYGQRAILLEVKMPDPPPLPTILVELPSIPGNGEVEAKEVRWGLTWAIAHGLVTLLGISDTGTASFAYTDKAFDEAVAHAPPDVDRPWWQGFDDFEAAHGLAHLGILLSRDDVAASARLLAAQQRAETTPP